MKSLFFFLSIIVGFSILASLSLLFSLVFFILITNSIPDGYDEYSYYQFQEIHNNETNFGITKLKRKLSDNEFFSYSTHKPGSFVIVSRFSSSQFECSGSCHCSERNENVRRHSATILTRSLFLLISALSSSVAFRMAEQSFLHQCHSEFSHICSPEKISTKVFQCTYKPEVEENQAEYMCHGHCQRKPLKNPSSIKAQNEFYDLTGGCEQLEIDGLVRVKRLIYNKDAQDRSADTLERGIVRYYPNRYGTMNQYAKSSFLTHYLTPFCRKTSKVEYWYVNSKKTGGRKRKKVNMCGSRKSEDRSVWNVKCRLVSKPLHLTKEIRQKNKEVESSD